MELFIKEGKVPGKWKQRKIAKEVDKPNTDDPVGVPVLSSVEEPEETSGGGEEMCLIIYYDLT